MSVEYFLDTNVLLYRYSDQDIDKRRIAANLLESGRAIASGEKAAKRGQAQLNPPDAGEFDSA